MNPLEYFKKFLLYRLRERDIFKKKDIKNRFTEIYKTNYWGSPESISGTGSTLRYTENLRKNLPGLFEKFSIQTIFDAPCGDFNWMKEVVQGTNIMYLGGEIVSEIVSKNNLLYSARNIRFIDFDITSMDFPDADLMICRDCLFHLSYRDIRSFLDLFLKSNIKYLLTTTHVNNGSFKNRDIESGDFRKIDLFSSPFNFPNEFLYRVQDWLPPDPQREICLWSREQLTGISSDFKRVHSI